MKNLTAHPSRPATRLAHPVRPALLVLLVAALLALPTLALSLEPSALSTPPPDPSAFSLQPSALQPVLDGLLGKYGWLTTVLLVIGSLRILFKPVMLVVENALKNDPDRLAAIQQFEAGPIYKTIATVLDVGASIKLPLVKPPGPPTS
jgi:hypothetical protein